MVELLTITIETFLQNHLIFFAYQIQPSSKKNLKYVYKNIVWLDTRASLNTHSSYHDCTFNTQSSNNECTFNTQISNHDLHLTHKVVIMTVH